MTRKEENTEIRPERIYAAHDTLLVVTPLVRVEEAAPHLTDDDLARIGAFTGDKRRREQASWRSVVRRFAGTAPIAYTETGAPYLRDGSRHIGVSHTHSQAAVILSDRRCAVDIERIDRNFPRVAARFLSQQEAARPQSHEALFLPWMWCAKEALYKFAGRKGLDLTEDLRVIRIEMQSGQLTGAIRHSDGTWREYPMHAFTEMGTACVWMTDTATAPTRP